MSSELKGNALLPITDNDFQRLVKFVQGKYGIDLHQKRQLIVSRLGSTVKGKGFSSYKEYVDYMDVSQKMVVSVATAMIPFLENDDTNRKIMRKKKNAMKNSIYAMKLKKARKMRLLETTLKKHLHAAMKLI